MNIFTSTPVLVPCKKQRFPIETAAAVNMQVPEVHWSVSETEQQGNYCDTRRIPWLSHLQSGCRQSGQFACVRFRSRRKQHNIRTVLHILKGEPFPQE